jgi:hypothetical protein
MPGSNQRGEWPYPPDLTRQELYALMRQSGLPPAEFYTRHVGRPLPEGMMLEAAGRPASPAVTS